MKRWNGAQPNRGIGGRLPTPTAHIDPQPAQTKTVEVSLSWWRRDWLLGSILLAVTILAYQPVWRAGFIWDDDQYVSANATLRSLHGLRRIWFEPGATPQYYPLSFTVFWLQFHLWGLNPLGYHLVNVLLHSGNAILFWLILRKLAVPGAWFAACLFSLHPVCVESVAWITELKNTLSGLLYLSAILVGLRFWLPTLDRPTNQPAPEHGRWKFYWVALVLYVCALWSKTATVPLPVVIFLLLWWKRKKLNRQDALLILPFLIVGLVMALVTVQIEKHLGAAASTWGISWSDRFLIAGRAIFFYLGKLIWPRTLIFVYPRWDISSSRILSLVLLLALVAILSVLWLKRQAWGRPILCASVYFLALLFPVVGFFNVYYFRYSFLSDHFQYLACLGPLALAATGMTFACGMSKRKLVRWTLCAALLSLLGFQTWRQCQMYEDVETLWRTTLSENPSAFLAHNNLGHLLFQQGRTDEALFHLRQAVGIQPDDATAQDNLGSALLRKGAVDEAISHFRKALEIRPDYALANNNFGNALLQEGQAEEALGYYQKALAIQPSLVEASYNLGNALIREGKTAAAIEQWQKTLGIEPDYVPALNNLGTALLQQGRINEALVYLQKAVAIRPGFAEAQNNLGTALLEDRQTIEAIQHFRCALKGQPNFVPAENNLAWILATCPDVALRNGKEALELARHSNEVSGGQNPVILRTLAAAYAEAGQYENAVITAQQAVQMAENQSNNGLLNSLQAELRVFESRLPFRDAGLANRTAK